MLEPWPRNPYDGDVSKKSAKIAALIESCRGEELDPHYLGYFLLFNQQLYYESHDVLEELWLADRKGPHGDFYKGLIQLAGAFVHLQKNRLKPANALFTLAETNLSKYPSPHERLNVKDILELITSWKKELAKSDYQKNPFVGTNAPSITLLKA
jgi:predicted metal-dependent hydrolase